MRVNKTIVVIISLLAFGWGLGATQDGIKIGIVDLDHAVGSSKEGAAARDELERKQRDANLELQPMIERYQQLADEYQKNRVVFAPEKLREMELDITELKNRIELKQTELQNRLRVDSERVIGPLREKLEKVVANIGREEGFSLILVRNMPGVMYAREALDITDVVIKQFNEEE